MLIQSKQLPEYYEAKATHGYTMKQWYATFPCIDPAFSPMPPHCLDTYEWVPPWTPDSPANVPLPDTLMLLMLGVLAWKLASKGASK